MSDNSHDSLHAAKRRARRDAHRDKFGGRPAAKSGNQLRRQRRGRARAPERLLLYGLHTVRHALENPARNKIALYVTANALTRLNPEPRWLEEVTVEEVHPRKLDKLVGADAVHQGCVLEAMPIEKKGLEAVSNAPLLLVLDQVSDPHNAGAILRSATAMGAGAVITTSRHSPAETAVLAKAASGALDMIDLIEVRNLAAALKELETLGYQTIGLDSQGAGNLENAIKHDHVALVLGAEGRGLRRKTRDTCKTLARIDMPGQIMSLNVSNAAALALYIVNARLAAR